VIPKECKRLAEMDFPIAEVNKHAAREKSIRHGHPSTLHLWWARRPLDSSRAVLMALLLPDPCDAHCPEAFRKRAIREISELARFSGGVGGLPGSGWCPAAPLRPGVLALNFCLPGRRRSPTSPSSARMTATSPSWFATSI